MKVVRIFVGLAWRVFQISVSSFLPCSQKKGFFFLATRSSPTPLKTFWIKSHKKEGRRTVKTDRMVDNRASGKLLGERLARTFNPYPEGCFCSRFFSKSSSL